MTSTSWQFAIDVGGTFTDVLARRPDGTTLSHKLLSSGAVRGVVEEGSTDTAVVDPRRRAEPSEFWVGYTLSLIGPDERPLSPSPSDSSPVSFARVIGFESDRGRLLLDSPIAETATWRLAQSHSSARAHSYELRSHESAPITAIRYVMGLRLTDPIGPIEVRLGTTRATNALLERKGGKTAFVTTKGFGDILKIGYQDRPRLFDLNIRKRDELASTYVEIDERISATGVPLKPVNPHRVHRQLTQLKNAGIESLAICLLHSHINPTHEELVERVARKLGFPHISVSSRLARLERIVSRGDTTVVDAYLSPVIQGYIAELRRSLPQATILLMTSLGGLVSAENASGKDTVLSGPAGGVLGCRHVARAVGYARAIGFDMGGTSTDVCRIDEPPQELEYQLETVKAGVRIMSPMLAVETVAAGGGSLCEFDGQKLIVGPHSAGADPGPACYGRGGPLTVTDMNLALGRLSADHFPFPLNGRIVEEKLTALCEIINSTTSSTLSRYSLADGFIQIANANMASAIKQVSTAKGLDVRDYVLTAFGGAAGQHACGVARLLDIRRVLCSPFAGVLGALGIATADIKRMTQQSVEQPLTAGARQRLEETFAALTQKGRKQLLRDGVPADAIGPVDRTLDVCYEGQTSVLTVPADPLRQVHRAFEELHRRMYGYVHEARQVVIKAARVELTARTPRGQWSNSKLSLSSSAATYTQLMVNGAMTQVPIFTRHALHPGCRISGPAIVVESSSTLVIEDGWTADVLSTGDILLTDAGTAEERSETNHAVACDPIRLELFNNQFSAIAEQMGQTLRRTALSVNVKERMDYSCAIFTSGGDLVANAPHIPVHLGGMSDCVKCLIEDVRHFRRGDVYITNDPFRGGSHLNDVTVISPVHDECGAQLLFFTASRAHHAEIGGTRPGSMPPDSTSLAQEGILIRAFAWMHDGRARQDELRGLLTSGPHPSRSPEENLADIAAQVAANRTGARELAALTAWRGWDVVRAYMQHIQTAAERKMRSALSRLPDGAYRFEDRLDDGSPICVTLTIAGDSATIDFTGTAPALHGNLNANPSITRSAILYCLRCLIHEDIPLNAGVLLPIRLILPECFLNPRPHEDPSRCPAVVGGNVETSQRIVDCLFGALKLVAASQGTMNNVLMGNERFGYYETICGGAGAGNGFHGADAVHTHMTNTRLTDPEVLEARVPVRLVRFQIRRGSGGAGEWRGGCGVIREWEFLEPLDVSIISQRRTTAPYGLLGGGFGLPGRNILRRAGSDRDESLPPIVSLSVQPGDRLTIETPGGGGWGIER